MCPDDEDKPDSRYTWILQNCEITKFVSRVGCEAFSQNEIGVSNRRKDVDVVYKDEVGYEFGGGSYEKVVPRCHRF